MRKRNQSERREEKRGKKRENGERERKLFDTSRVHEGSSVAFEMCVIIIPSFNRSCHLWKE